MEGERMGRPRARRSPPDAANVGVAHPSYVNGFKQVDGYSLGSRLMHVWLER